MLENIAPWIPLLVATVPALITSYWAWRNTRVKRADDLKDQVLTAKERLAQSTDTQAREMIDKLGEQLRACWQDRETIETDRDRGWNLARWWNDKTHTVRHAYRGALHVANGRLERAGQPVVLEPDIEVPNDIEAPIPRR